MHWSLQTNDFLKVNDGCVLNFTRKVLKEGIVYTHDYLVNTISSFCRFYILQRVCTASLVVSLVSLTSPAIALNLLSRVSTSRLAWHKTVALILGDASITHAFV